MKASAADIPITSMGTDRIYSHADRMRVLSGILTCILLAALDQSVVLPALPQMAADLHGSAHLSWVVSAYLLTTTATTPIYGKLSDQLGRREILVPATIFFLFACVLCALSNSVTMLIVGRALQGVGGGALLSVSQSAIADVIPPRERGKYQGWFAGVWAVSSIAGPIAGGFIVQHFSWRWIFWANLPLGLVALFLCVRGLSGIATARRRTKIDFAGAGLLLLSVTLLLGALSTGGVDFPWSSLPVYTAFALSLIMFVVLAMQQRLATEPLFPGALLSKSGFRKMVVIAFLNSGAMFAAIFSLPLLLQGLLHTDAASSGLEIMPFLFTTTVGSYFGGQMAKRTGKTRNIIAGGLAGGAVAFLIMAALPLDWGVSSFVGVSALFGLGIGAVMPTSIVTVQTHAGPRDVGAATGILLLLRSMGGAFGATMAGAVLAIWPDDPLSGFRFAFCLCAVMLAIATVIALMMENATLRSSLHAIPPVPSEP